MVYCSFVTSGLTEGHACCSACQGTPDTDRSLVGFSGFFFFFFFATLSQFPLSRLEQTPHHCKQPSIWLYKFVIDSFTMSLTIPYLDLVFCVDCTGSMGSYIAQAQVRFSIHWHDWLPLVIVLLKFTTKLSSFFPLFLRTLDV
jgi:hypothetical protein